MALQSPQLIDYTRKYSDYRWTSILRYQFTNYPGFNQPIPLYFQELALTALDAIRTERQRVLRESNRRYIETSFFVVLDNNDKTVPVTPTETIKNFQLGVHDEYLFPRLVDTIEFIVQSNQRLNIGNFSFRKIFF